MRYGADIKAVDKEMKSCLHWAVEMQHLTFAEMLFEHGHGGEEIINWKDRAEQTALHYAAEVGNVKVSNFWDSPVQEFLQLCYDKNTDVL